MQSKPLAIAAVILLAAIMLAIFSGRDEDGGDTGQGDSEATQRSALRNGNDESTAARSARRQDQSAEDMAAPIPKKWADEINRLLGDDNVSVEQAATGLLQIVADKSAPVHARQEALEHALNLTLDRDHQAVQKLLQPANGKLPIELAQTILDDTYNRPAEIQIATAIKVLQGIRQGILQGDYQEIKEEAIELLEFHLEADHGENLEAWKKASEDHLKAQNNEQQDE